MQAMWWLTFLCCRVWRPKSFWVSNISSLIESLPNEWSFLFPRQSLVNVVSRSMGNDLLCIFHSCELHTTRKTRFSARKCKSLHCHGIRGYMCHSLLRVGICHLRWKGRRTENRTGRGDLACPFVKSFYVLHVLSTGSQTILWMWDASNALRRMTICIF